MAFILTYHVAYVFIMKMAGFRVAVQCGMVEINQHLRGPSCLYYHPDDECSKDL
jgi:hypothetical protein